MGSVRIAALAAVAAVAFTAGSARAADYPCQPQYPGGPLPPHCMTPPPPPPPPPVIEEFGGWYIRGDIGMTNQALGELFNANYPSTANLIVRDKNFESGMLWGLGVGYKWNSWMRFDVTGEYRGETGFHGLDTWFDGANARFNNYTGKKSEWLFMLNAYADLGTWGGVTPFVGAGIGFSRIGIHSLRDMGVGPAPALQPTLSYADSAYTWNIAYALHAGLAYEVSKNFTVELAYRYVYLGDGKSGTLIAYDGSGTTPPMEFRGIDSHDLKIGVRYLFASAPAPQYQMQQVFQPLMRRF
ncbi:MAG: outer membrane beta-barrel protein [Xanthobacteraceae bacterium]|nr:outer membrane beta-barrel protein [Xanthobacteraceae bacterium]